MRGADDDLDQLFAAVAALRALADDPDGSSDAARRYDFSIRWGTLLSGRLHRIEHYYRSGELDPGEQARFRILLGELRAAIPITENLGLVAPSLADPTSSID